MTTFSISLLGGGWVQMRLDAHDLHDVSEQLRRERSLIGELLDPEADGDASRVLIPAQRVVMVSERP
jgi:hypothetical protein